MYTSCFSISALVYCMLYLRCWLCHTGTTYILSWQVIYSLRWWWMNVDLGCSIWACELSQLSEVALITLYSVSDQWASESMLVVHRLCFHGGGLKPSLLIRDLHAYQSNSVQGRDDVFCLVQFTPLTLQEENHSESNCPVPLTKPDWTELLLSPSVYFLIAYLQVLPFPAWVYFFYFEYFD